MKLLDSFYLRKKSNIEDIEKYVGAGYKYGRLRARRTLTTAWDQLSSANATQLKVSFTMARFFLSPQVVQFLLVSCLRNVVLADSTSGAPTITLDYGTFQGTSTGNLTLFLGMPFARAP